MGLQISSGMDHEVPLSGFGWRCRASSTRIVERDSAEHGDDDLRRSDQSRSYTHADRNTAEYIGIESRAVSEGKEFAQIAIGISGAKKEILEAVLVGKRVSCAKSSKRGKRPRSSL